MIEVFGDFKILTTIKPICLGNGYDEKNDGVRKQICIFIKLASSNGRKAIVIQKRSKLRSFKNAVLIL